MKTQSIPQRSRPKPTAKGNQAPRKRRIRLTMETRPGSAVYAVGSFNNWDPGHHRLRESPTRPGHYERFLVLPPGRYEYKFVIDGKWSADPGCDQWVVNEFQTLNSVLVVEAR